MSNTPTFVTHAGNFTSAVSGQVDPRTGLYGTNISLGTIVGNRGLGPTFPINMSYSPMSSIHSSQNSGLGFGAGISLGFSVYDAHNRLLTLSTGARYKVLEQDIRQGYGNGRLQLDQTLLDTVHFEKDDDCYRIIYKSGRVDILIGPEKASNLKLPTQILTPAGHALTFNWDYSKDPIRLESITDDTVTDSNPTILLSFDAVNSIFGFLPGQAEGYNVQLTYTAEGDSLNHLTGICNQGVTPALQWQLTYDWVGDNRFWGKWLTRIDAPGGAAESVEYRWWDSQGHRFPNSANLPVLPAVYTYMHHPGANQPDIQKTYSYTEKNFLGYGSGVAWSAERDNLYDVLGNYEYGSTETCGTQVIMRSYDKYHLQIAEAASMVQDKATLTTKTTRTEYYADYTVPFNQQKKKYAQLPKTTSVSWEKDQITSDPVTTSYDWDEWANPLFRCDPDGLLTTWTYYDGTQDDPDGNCPKDPNGFTRFAKLMTVDPTKVHGAEPGAALQKINYKYTTVVGRHSEDAGNLEGESR